MESRRERKKRQTRQLLADTAIGLFAEQGYEQTTVAQIASAADVATKTFFNHFSSKEDVLFGAAPQNNDTALRVIADRRPSESIADLLTRAYEEMVAEYHAQTADTHDPALLEAYTHLLTTVPALQAKALQQVFQLQKEIAAALAAEFPDQLDQISAAALVGAVTGATQAAALTSLELGQSGSEFWAALRRAVDTALRGWARTDDGPQPAGDR